MSEKVASLEDENAALKAELEQVDSEMEVAKKILADIGKSQARSYADMDILRGDINALSGTIEERDFELARVKENLDLLSDTINSLEQRLMAIERLGLTDQAAAEGDGNGQASNPIDELRASIEKLSSRLSLLESKIGEDKPKVEPDRADTEAKEALPDPGTLYMDALNKLRIEKDYLNGLEEFRRFLSLFPKHELADNAQYWIGEIYYGQGDWERAALEFNKVREGYPEGDKLSAALLKLGLCFEKLGDTESATSLLESVIEKYPDSSEAELAKEHLKKSK